MSLATIGDALRRAGLTQPALLAWAGTHRLSALREIVPALVERPLTPASSALALFVAGAVVPRDRLHALPLDELSGLGIVEIDGDYVRAKLAILPVEQTFIVCDRFDARSHREIVMCPDDSSYHLAASIPAGRRDRWIDLATGSAFAPLTRPGLASAITGIDLNPRAVELSRLGAGLSGCTHFESQCADIADASGRAALVTCNAPILGDPDDALWYSTGREFFFDLWRVMRACLEPGGIAIVHCVLEGVPQDLEGESTIVLYTPPGIRSFAITWWVPDAPARSSMVYRPLSPARPFIEARDRDDVLADG